MTRIFQLNFGMRMFAILNSRSIVVISFHYYSKKIPCDENKCVVYFEGQRRANATGTSRDELAIFGDEEFL